MERKGENLGQYGNFPHRISNCKSFSIDFQEFYEESKPYNPKYENFSEFEEVS